MRFAILPGLMSSEARWIDSTAELAAEAGRIGAGPLALDTEADSFHHYREKVCLVQASFDSRDLLIDPLAGVDLSPLAEMLASERVPVILHGADYDLRLLHRDFGLEVRGLFDTMIAARLIGETSFGLAALLERHFGVRLDKSHQRADWSRRPLPEAMARYAALDTRYLQRLAERQRVELDRLGRQGWAEEEFRRLEAVRWTPREAAPAWRRVRQSGRLSRRELGVLGELAELREAEARHRDVPVFRVMRDEVLVELARRAPRRAGELAPIGGLPGHWRRQPGAGRLVEAVARGQALPDDELPEPPPPSRRAGPADPRLATLRRERDRIAARLGLEPSIVATRAALEQVLEALDRGEDPSVAEPLRDWQRELLAPAFAALGQSDVP